MFDKLFKVLKPVVFNYKKDKIEGLDTDKKFIGVMAQDIRKGLVVEGFDPDEFSIVQTDENGYYTVDYVQLIPILIDRIKKLEDEVKNIKR
ncbi:MAG: hypothetical protein KAH35_02815 [Candidatus Atribacteria bacterium]|nr:hypothetical protein [Candidatus Atribacteria bacterium]